MILRRHRLVCRQAVELMSDYLEGALSARDRRRLEAHLRQCEHCTEYLHQMRLVIEASGQVEPDDLTPEALDELTSLYRRWQQDGA